MNKHISPFIICISILSLIFLSQCIGGSAVLGEDKPDDSGVMGFGILKQVPGQWHGPVTSDTPAGSFPMWYVDFRPVSPGQVSQYSILDEYTINYISFFIVKHGGMLKVALRTEGVFQKKGCVTYEVIDKVDEAQGYYRFSDFQAGMNRAYTEFRFKGDSFEMNVYTNKFNKVSPLEIHSTWRARLGSRDAASRAVEDLNFPRAKMVKDFSNVFQDMSESIYFTFERDPYPSASQPYVGTITVDIGIDPTLEVKKNHELFLLLTTESLFGGLTYKKDNLKYISKYVYLPPGTKTYTFTHVHPGTYYLYSYNDVNGDKRHLKGDYMSSDLENVITLKPEGSATVKTVIDFVIP
jgi:hypothetical protein